MSDQQLPIDTEQVQAAAEKAKDGFWSDTATSLDSAGQIIDLVTDVGSFVVQGVHATGSCIAAICGAIPDIDL